MAESMLLSESPGEEAVRSTDFASDGLAIMTQLCHLVIHGARGKSAIRLCFLSSSLEIIFILTAFRSFEG